MTTTNAAARARPAPLLNRMVKWINHALYGGQLPDNLKVLYDTLPRDRVAEFRPTTHEVVIDDARCRDEVHSLLHELSHVATMNEWNQTRTHGPEFRAELKRLEGMNRERRTHPTMKPTMNETLTPEQVDTLGREKYPTLASSIPGIKYSIRNGHVAPIFPDLNHAAHWADQGQGQSPLDDRLRRAEARAARWADQGRALALLDDRERRMRARAGGWAESTADRLRRARERAARW